MGTASLRPVVLAARAQLVDAHDELVEPHLYHGGGRVGVGAQPVHLAPVADEVQLVAAVAQLELAHLVRVGVSVGLGRGLRV